MSAILYSFRRCPYAMRARLAIAASHSPVLLREIILKHKPAEMLALSPKGTVPVLQLESGEVLEESLDIMLWALRQADPLGWLKSAPQNWQQWVTRNDQEFKPYLDKYKYAVRFPEQSPESYRQQAEIFIADIEQQLKQTPYLLGQQQSLADMAILPFVRQFASVDLNWFEQAPYPKTQAWLKQFIDSALFRSIMKKYPTWLDSQQQFRFPESARTPAE
ncbi:glutathione S-transferase [Agarivorans gilvus]|jgi:glutathione S-transferase|uniref:Glutathione S-transferase n=1 Tax=Agarivorans gilvus TaxID=680279 RepID=A0ABQ1HYN3_9ALTE|nr:glutathione S-transferase [Agarivorans gilvus]GGA99744.1 glutathione S-transferase [Agarivorans gilvus]